MHGIKPAEFPRGHFEFVEPHLNDKECFELIKIAYETKDSRLTHMALILLRKSLNPMMIFKADEETKCTG